MAALNVSYDSLVPVDWSQGWCYLVDVAGSEYDVEVKTGKKSHADAQAKIYIVLFGGSDAKQSTGRQYLREGTFMADQMDSFPVQVPESIDEFTRIQVCYDNVQKKLGWFLERVSVQIYPLPPSTPPHCTS